jgi:hypothetical protein
MYPRPTTGLSQKATKGKTLGLRLQMAPRLSLTALRAGVFNAH